MSDELNSLFMAPASTGESKTFRAVYYLNSLAGQVLTEFVDEEGELPSASWQIVAVETLPFSQLADRYQARAAWGVLSFLEQPGGAFILADSDSVRTLIGLPPGELDDAQFNGIDATYQRISEAFAEAWSEVASFESQLGTFLEAPDMAEISELFSGLGPQTPMLSTTFRVNVPSQPLARVVLAMPQPYVIPLASALEPFAENTYTHNSGEWMDDRLELLGDTPVPLVVYLGSTSMTVQELHSLEEDDVILLEQGVGNPLVIEFGGRARILGMPGTSPDGVKKAVQIVRLEGP